MSGAQAAALAPLRVIGDNDPNVNTLWVDTVNREIVVANDGQETLQVNSTQAHGVVAALREVKGRNTFVSFPGQVFVGPVHGKVWWVGNDTADLVTVYPRTANGDVAAGSQAQPSDPTAQPDVGARQMSEIRDEYDLCYTYGKH